MSSFTKALTTAALIAGITSPAIAELDFSERVEFSGFGRVIGGYLDSDKAEYEGYGDSFSLSQQSLFALQTEITITDKLSFSTQLLAHSSEERESGVEWMYLTYEPNQNWRFKVGKLRTPFFKYADTVDVGFAYPWITTPQQVYGGFLFSNYEGASGAYRFSVGHYNFDLEGYFGKYTGEFDRAGDSIALDINDIKGLIFRVNRGNVNARISTIRSADFYADIPGFAQFANTIEFLGFSENADSLRFNQEVNSYQANINYDSLDYFLAAEWVKIDSDLLVVPSLDAYYMTAGYNFSVFQLHATYAKSNSSYGTPENLIPKGVDPQVTQLSFAYDAIVSNLPQYSLDSLSLGLRWDFRYNMSAKAEVTFLNGEPGENSYYSEITDPSFDRKATLYQVGIEWVF